MKASETKQFLSVFMSLPGTPIQDLDPDPSRLLGVGRSATGGGLILGPTEVRLLQGLASCNGSTAQRCKSTVLECQLAASTRPGHSFYFPGWLLDRLIDSGDVTGHGSFPSTPSRRNQRAELQESLPRSVVRSDTGDRSDRGVLRWSGL